MKPIFSNFISLSALQWVNYILPLVTFPYLVRVLGVEIFGILALVTAITSYLNIVVDYGFNVTAVNDIAKCTSKDKIEKGYSSILTVKIILVSLCFVVMLCVVFLFDFFLDNLNLYLLSFGMVIGRSITTDWFFLGMNSAKYSAYINIFAKLIFTVLILWLVNNKDDYYLVPLFTSLGYIASGLLSLIIVKAKFNIGFTFQKKHIVKDYLKQNWHMFVTNIYTNIYATVGLIFLGIMTNNVIVGYYSIAEKIAHAAANLLIPFVQAIYPHMSKRACSNNKIFFSEVKIVSIVIFVFSVLMTLLLFKYDNLVVSIVTGEKDNQSTLSIFSILIFLVITTPIITLYVHTLIIGKMQKYVRLATRDALILSVVFMPIGIYWKSSEGVSIVVILTQVFLLLVFTYKIISLSRDL